MLIDGVRAIYLSSSYYITTRVSLVLSTRRALTPSLLPLPAPHYTCVLILLCMCVYVLILLHTQPDVNSTDASSLATSAAFTSSSSSFPPSTSIDTLTLARSVQVFLCVLTVFFCYFLFMCVGFPNFFFCVCGVCPDCHTSSVLMLVHMGASLQLQWYGSGASYAYAAVNQIGTVNQMSTAKAVAGALSEAAPVLHRSSPADLCAAFSWILPLGGECLCIGYMYWIL